MTREQLSELVAREREAWEHGWLTGLEHWRVEAPSPEPPAEYASSESLERAWREGLAAGQRVESFAAVVEPKL